MNSIDIDLANKYQQKTDKQHILDNPDTYIGSVEKIDSDQWILNEAGDTIVEKQIEYIPGLFKLFDEGIVNCRDHVVRMQQAISSANSDNCIPVTNIDITIEEDGTIIMYNDGNGIDVAQHPEYNIWIPELIFGHLRTSTNYDKTEKKIVGGKNGFGFKLVLIWSTYGSVETVDHIRNLKYYQEFKNNLDEIGAPSITKCKNKPYTKITFKPDYLRLGIPALTPDIISLLKKRVYDVAAVTDKNLKVRYNSTLVPIKNFQQYIDLYIGDKSVSPRVYEDNGPGGRWEYAIALTPSDEFVQISFVNGIHTTKGGKHVEYILGQITRKLCEYIEKKKKVKVNPNCIKEQLILFLRCDIENPAFDSQTKDYMNTPSSKFGSKCDVSEKFIEKVAKMGVMDAALQLTEVKENKAAKKTDGTKSKSVRGVPKLTDANWAGTDKSNECIIIFCEGDSAKSGIISGLSSDDRNTIGVYPLKGKLRNIRGVNVKISENKEITEIKKILGLETGKNYSQEDIHICLRYSKIMFMVDQDADGSHIKGLCINLFHSEWPSLLYIPGFICFMNTPILKAKKGNMELNFYNNGEYDEWTQTNNTKGWNIKYYKGLGTSTGTEFKEYFKNKKIVEFANNGKISDEAIDMAFNKKRADDRKEWLGGYERDSFIDTSKKIISYEEFINKELIHFSKYDCDRSIPNLMDGLKISLRKILFAAFKKNLTAEIKVAQFSGYISEHSCYHHGEASLNAAIIGMAQNFAGSNNINLLEPHGQFGCLSPDTPILLWDGNIKNAKDILVGDILVGDDGNKRVVLKLTNGIDDMYKINLSNGKSFTVNSQHILTLQFENNLKIFWKESNQSWYMIYYDKNDEKIKTITNLTSDSKKSNHFNSCKLSKNEAYEKMVSSRNKLIQQFGSEKIIDIKLMNYLKISKFYRRGLHMINNLNSINWGKKDLPIDPYILGAWLGDGDQGGNGFTTIDDEIVKSFAIWADTINAEITHQPNSGREDCYHYGIRRKNSGRVTSIGDINNSSSNCIACCQSSRLHPSCDWVFQKTPEKINHSKTINGQNRTDLNPFKEILKQNNLYKNKFIPSEYIYNDENNRLQLLAGFIDTDGCLKQNNTRAPSFEISQSDRLHGNLIDSLNIISQSLGFATSISYCRRDKLTKKGENMTIKTLRIFGEDLDRIPTRIPRKQIIKTGKSTKASMHYSSFEVLPIGKGEFYGWSIDNNERFLLGDFTITHNSRLEGGDDSASERYIFTMLNKITRTIFPQQDDHILKYLNDDGTPVEPIYYAPIIPMVLVNGSNGIGTGFSTNIMCYNPIQIIQYLKNKLASVDTTTIEFIPYYDGFKGIISKISDEKFLIKGLYETIEVDKIRVTELPIGYWTEDFKLFLDGLVEPGQDKEGKKITPVIKDFKNLSTDTNIDFTIIFAKGILEELEAKEVKMDEYTCNGVEKLLKLCTTKTTTNMHLFDSNEKLQKYENVSDIIDAYYEVRLQLYQTRKDYMINAIEKELVLLSNKAKYIQENLDETIDLRKKKKEQVIEMLHSKGYDIMDEDADYKYLTKMPMDSVTEENVEKLLNDRMNQAKELEMLTNSTTNQLWNSELDTLLEQYLEYKTCRQQLMNGDEAKDKTTTKKKIVSKKSSVKKPTKTLILEDDL
jgi:DNA gyrase/topoisomerase IV subunit B